VEEGKLKEKKQNDQQLKQAFHAVSLYYELGLIDSQKDNLFKDRNQNLSTKKGGQVLPSFFLGYC